MQKQADIKALIEQTKQKRTLKQNYNKNYFNEVFKPLLTLEQHFEELAIKRLLTFYNFDNPKIKRNDDKRYDVKIIDKGKRHTYEFKTDIKAIDTNNLYIEYMSNNVLSGISSTNAKNYVIIIPYDTDKPLMLLIKVNVLKELIIKEQYFLNLKGNEKNNFTAGYLFKLETLLKHSKLI